MSRSKIILPTKLPPELSGMQLGLTGIVQSINAHKTKILAEIFHYEHQKLTEIDNTKVIIFSISNPLEYDLVFDFCKKVNIPVRASQRSDDMPILVGGGMGFTNPEPLADFFDVIIQGISYQPLISLLDEIDHLDSAPKQALFRRLCEIPNLYIPSLIHLEYLSDGKIRSIKAEYNLIRQDTGETSWPLSGKIGKDEAILMPDIGCQNKCSFCARTFFYDYQAARIDDLKTEIDNLSSEGIKKIKINSSNAFQYCHLSELLEYIKDKGISVALGSVRIDEIRDLNLRILNSIHTISETQHLYRVKPSNDSPSLTFGIESASNRLLRLINKNLSYNTIKKQIYILLKNGLKNIGYYFISGLTTEIYKDQLAVSELISFTVHALDAVKGEVFINVNPFIPTPNTPMQRLDIISEDKFKEWIKFVQENVQKNVGFDSFKRRVHFGYMPLNDLLLQTITIRSDRRISRFLELYYKNGGSIILDDTRANQLLNRANLPNLQFYRRRITKDEILPWQLVLPCHITLVENDYYKREEEAYQEIGSVP